MTEIAKTPKPPYYAVIFTSLRTDDADGYAAMAERLMAAAGKAPGFLGVESAREGLGITVSYWADIESIARWKADAVHAEAQRLGRERWYASFMTRVAKVERDHAL